MYKVNNRKVEHNNKTYEIFWVTDFADHVMPRENHSSHRISIKEVEQFATTCSYYPYKKDIMIGLGKHKNKYYQLLSYFVTRPGKRCVIKTCHVVHEPHIIELCKKIIQ